MKKKSSRFLLAAALIVVAALLPFFCFQYRFERYRCEADYCYLPDQPLWVGSEIRYFGTPLAVRNPRTHKLLILDGKPLMSLPLIEGQAGVFPREGVPMAAALVGGILIPFLLLGYATILLFRRPIWARAS